MNAAGGMRRARRGWDTEGVVIHETSLAALRPVFEQWIRLIPQYAAMTRPILGSPDYPFWYNERASIGTIAAAARLAKGAALEEYSARKRGARGRADLWILINRNPVRHRSEADLAEHRKQSGRPHI